METETPDVPDDVPKYVADGLERQDSETLREIQDYVAELIEWQQREVEPEEVADDDEEIVGVEEHERGTVVSKMVPCGKDCEGCPHGPYEYLAYRDGGTVKTEYLGPVEGDG
jgi:hypothetical protein